MEQMQPEEAPDNAPPPESPDAAPDAPQPDDEASALRAELAARTAREEAALAQFRAALLATEPALDPGLVTGDSFETVHASFSAARASLARVRQALRDEAAARISAGAPGRTVPSPRTPLEKIREGLARE